MLIIISFISLSLQQCCKTRKTKSLDDLALKLDNSLFVCVPTLANQTRSSFINTKTKPNRVITWFLRTAQMDVLFESSGGALTPWMIRRFAEVFRWRFNICHFFVCKSQPRRASAGCVTVTTHTSICVRVMLCESKFRKVTKKHKLMLQKGVVFL